MSDDLEVTIGSPDSGVGEALAASLDKLLLDKTEDNEKDKGQIKRSEESVVESPKPNNDQRVAIVPMHPHKLRGMSISSDDTSPSLGEEHEAVIGPRTREERLALLKELLETYFSDNYLTRDIFLLKHFRKSKEGWISLKFMASYKKIKRTAKSREEVEEAVKMSPLLELNVEGNKIRRLAPFPACIDEYIPTRMTILGSLPKDMRNLTSLSNFLIGYGEVASLQILRPGVNVPEILIETANTFPEMRDQWCALVEFDEIQAAGKLASDINDGKTSSGFGWALELVMSWKNKKNSDRHEKITSPTATPTAIWTEPIKNRCRSCPSSGYSSPCLTPEQSPIVCPGRHINSKGLSKRERILLARSCQTTCCQHAHIVNTCSPCSRNVYNNRSPRQSVGCGYRSPKTPKSIMTAETCDNWRTASIN